MPMTRETQDYLERLRAALEAQIYFKDGRIIDPTLMPGGMGGAYLEPPPDDSKPDEAARTAARNELRSFYLRNPDEEVRRAAGRALGYSKWRIRWHEFRKRWSA
jgi:hypothetical protein